MKLQMKKKLIGVLAVCFTLSMMACQVVDAEGGSADENANVEDTTQVGQDSLDNTVADDTVVVDDVDTTETSPEGTSEVNPEDTTNVNPNTDTGEPCDPQTDEACYQKLCEEMYGVDQAQSCIIHFGPRDDTTNVDPGQGTIDSNIVIIDGGWNPICIDSLGVISHECGN
jgi:hypothetical protein